MVEMTAAEFFYLCSYWDKDFSILLVHHLVLKVCKLNSQGSQNITELSKSKYYLHFQRT